MTDHFKQIYQNRANDYHRLVAAEDYQGNLLRTLQNIHPLDGATVAEWGGGTGRITTLIAPFVSRILGHDISYPMLQVAQQRTMEAEHVTLCVADHQAIPLQANIADIALEGWAFGHYRFWNADTWQSEIKHALSEMERVLKPGGTMIVIETLGTGFEEPQPPEGLAEVYAYLQEEQGFTSKWCRTDYQFASEAEAQELVTFFFGDGVLPAVIVPECTGFWWKVIN